MNTYEVEYKRTSYVIIKVEASSPEQADALAWEQVEREAADLNDAAWELSEITLDTPQEAV